MALESVKSAFFRVMSYKLWVVLGAWRNLDRVFLKRGRVLIQTRSRLKKTRWGFENNGSRDVILRCDLNDKKCGWYTRFSVSSPRSAWSFGLDGASWGMGMPQ